MEEMQERKVTITASLNKNCATLENEYGQKWKLERCKHLRSAIAIMVAETLWNQFDTMQCVSSKFELTMTMKLMDK